VIDIDRSHSYSCSTVQGTRGFHSVRSSNNPLFEIWMQKLACFCSPYSSGEWDECECMDWVDDWDRVSLAVDPRVVIETTHLEEGQSAISTDYDHISDLVQLGHIYAVVAPKDNEWGTYYWLARCIRGKQILNGSLIDDEGNEFPIGSMVVEGEYLTLDGKSRRTSGHVFVDYRPGSMVYHFTNLIVGTNIHLQKISNKNSSKVRYFLPHSEHERLMETISNREDPDGYIE